MLRLKNKEYENIKFSIYKKRKKIHNYSFLKIRSYPLFKNYEIENENENINKWINMGGLTYFYFSLSWKQSISSFFLKAFYIFQYNILF